ncbi:MAG: NgoFVII family restriction endonuclease [Clostridiaceae bacterium]|nr:NgoFVII family restriction endonuclease [Clostridiaceae bacterium]
MSERLHTTLLKLNDEMTNTAIYYSNLPVHSKCYIWKKKSKIVTALIGSANFSVNGLSNPYKEVLAETTFDTFEPLNQYTQKILGYCIECDDSSIKLRDKNIVTPKPKKIITPEIDGVCKASLLDSRTGEVPAKSGLNWGLSFGHTTLGDAYIRISKDYVRNNPDIFPPKQLTPLSFTTGAKQTRQNEAVEFIWDDGTIMEGLLEQTQIIDGVAYPKAISSSPRKNILGIYLRRRLGVPLDYLITRADLERYGRTDIDISLLEEGVYYLDFSPKSKS